MSNCIIYSSGYKYIQSGAHELPKQWQEVSHSASQCATVFDFTKLFSNFRKRTFRNGLTTPVRTRLLLKHYLQTCRDNKDRKR